MSFELKLVIMTALAVAIGATLSTRRPPATSLSARVTSRSGGLVTVWLVVIAGALLMVGIVSHTLLRHVVQIAPLVGAVSLGLRGSSLGVSAAVPLFGFWFLIMSAIWLFLLGVAQIVSGTFTSAEIALTVIIGAASVLGLAAAWRQSVTRTPARLFTVVGFAVLQLAAMWISLQPFVARR
ncbi:MAG: hypothetical protein DMF97_17810 [Acidobacteria bacterium]|nr:MAG: hypothetical protein DMF97_17810 [Acidobacteriota bacterium]